MSTEVDTTQPDTEFYQQYRALSSAAVASVIVGLLSAAAVLDWSLLAIPLIGILVSLYALVRLRRNRHELSGQKLAVIGLGLSVAFAVLGPSVLIYDYVTEVPDGYDRISYVDLQPDERVPGQIVPPGANELEGKRVFIKGYIYPGRQKDGIREFLLVRDQGDCCFGGNPKITDRILIRTVGALRVKFEQRVHKVAGTFHVAPAVSAPDGAKGGLFYQLDADYVR